MLMFGLDYGSLEAIINHPLVSNRPIMWAMMLVNSIAIFLVPPLIYSYFYSNATFSFLKLKMRPSRTHILLTIGIMVCAIPFINFLSEFNTLVLDTILGDNNSLKLLEKSAEKKLESIFTGVNFAALLMNILIVAVLPAISEEISFRGAIQQSLNRLTKSQHVSIILTGLLFSAVHFQFYGFIPRAFLGIMFGYMVMWSGSLWVPIIAHFVNNGITAITLFAIDNNYLPQSSENLGGDSDTMTWGILSGIVCIGLFRLFYLIYLKDQKSKEQSLS